MMNSMSILGATRPPKAVFCFSLDTTRFRMKFIHMRRPCTKQISFTYAKLVTNYYHLQ